MNFQRLRAITRKEFLHVIRDPGSLIMAIILPVFLLVLFGWALALDVDRVPLVVMDRDNTPTSRDFVARFTGSRFFALAGNVSEYSEIESALDRRNAMAALVLPETFTDDVKAGRQSHVQFLLDGSDANTATIALGYARSIAMSFNQEIMIQRIRRAGQTAAAWPLDVRARVWFNNTLESKNYIIPGLLAVIMSMIAALLTSLTIAREWERGTMEQLLSTPVRPVELILGKLAPYFAIGFADLVLSILMARYAFNVPLRGDLLVLFFAACMFLLGALAQGMIISIITKNQLAAAQVALLSTFLPALLLSGFAFAIDNMPPFMRLVTYLIPARYFVTILKGIYLKGAGVEILASELLILSIFAPLMFLLAVKKFKKKLQ